LAIRNQIRKVYEADADAVICGSTALFLYGDISRMPNDLDVISSKHQELSKMVKESSGESHPEDEFEPEPHDDMDDLAYHLEKMCEEAEDFYDLVQKVKKMLSIDSHEKLPDTVYKMTASSWKRFGKKNESFELKFSGIDICKMCVFESTKATPAVTEFYAGGMNIKLEDRDTVLKYKKAYGRVKDSDDLKKMDEGKKFKIKTFENFTETKRTMKMFEAYNDTDDDGEKKLKGVKAMFAGDAYDVYIFKYADNDRVALELMLPNGDLGPRATYNIPEEDLADDEVIINDLDANEGVLQSLIDAKVISKPVRHIGRFPVCKLLKTVYDQVIWAR
jgi:hypothetical protein